MKSFRTLAAFAWLAGTSAAFAADHYTIDPAHTFPRFEVSHFGFSTHRGQFNTTAGKLVLDRAAKTGNVEITVQTASIGTGDPHQSCAAISFSTSKNFPL